MEHILADNQQKTKDKATKVRLAALGILANLSAREAVRDQII